MTAVTARVVVVGGGYAGVMAANRLRRPGVGVTVVNARPYFVERIRLHQLVTGSDDACVDYADLLGPGIALVVGTATRIEVTGRQLHLQDGTTLAYDYLVYALGSGSSVPEFAYGIADVEQARALKTTLDALPPQAPVCVVGAGLTGIETAAELAERGRAVTLVCDPVLGPSLSAPGRRAAQRRLRTLGVDLVPGRVTEVDAEAVTLTDGRTLASRATVWTAGFDVPALAAASGLHTDAIGRLLTDETLTSLDDPHIVAAGDAAAPSGAPLRMSCQAAIPLGAQAADTVLARIAGRRPADISQAYTGQALSLGRAGGLIQAARTDDTPVPLFLGGRAAAAVKETICKTTVAFLRWEARKPGRYRWLRGGKR